MAAKDNVDQCDYFELIADSFSQHKAILTSGSCAVPGAYVVLYQLVFVAVGVSGDVDALTSLIEHIIGRIVAVGLFKLVCLA